MAFKKREETREVNAAKKRLSAVEKIDMQKGKEIDYGDEGRSLTKATYIAQIAICENLTNEYNQSLVAADALLNNLIAEEKKLSDMSSDILSSAKGKFGWDSNEYEMLGGVRKSERKKPVRTPNDQ